MLQPSFEAAFCVFIRGACTGRMSSAQAILRRSLGPNKVAHFGLQNKPRIGSKTLVFAQKHAIRDACRVFLLWYSRTFFKFRPDRTVHFPDLRPVTALLSIRLASSQHFGAIRPVLGFRFSTFP